MTDPTALDWFGPGHPGFRVAAEALAGDPLALVALEDVLEEEGVKIPFAVGEEWFVCTSTLYYVGRVKEVGFGWVLFGEASWVHWTGRLSVLLAERNFTSANFGSRKPRTEYVGDVLVFLGGCNSAYGPPWELPKECVQ